MTFATRSLPPSFLDDRDPERGDRLADSYEGMRLGLHERAIRDKFARQTKDTAGADDEQDKSLSLDQIRKIHYSRIKALQLKR